MYWSHFSQTGATIEVSDPECHRTGATASLGNWPERSGQQRLDMRAGFSV